ncbi:MAG TPA: TetR/AcrR family transcriptional regulator [Symbiobacteriaceae bacterium]|nr:TetR/AcrR family transcriptional regulator [Symbiobacteriaceae bacterium]
MSPRVSDQHKEQRREQILEAAGRCFARQGYAQTSMQEILRESGLSAGAVYSYYQSKQDLYMALMERNLETDLRRFAAELEREGTPWERLRRLVELYMANFADPAQTEFLQLYLLEFLPASPSNPPLAAALRRRNQRLQALFSQVLQEGVAKGAFRPLSWDDAAALIIAAGDGVRLHALTIGTLAGAQTMYHMFLRNLWQVVRPD